MTLSEILDLLLDGILSHEAAMSEIHKLADVWSRDAYHSGRSDGRDEIIEENAQVHEKRV